MDRVQRSPCYTGNVEDEEKRELASSLHLSAKWKEHGETEHARHCGINGRGPGYAGRETVYAAKGLDMSCKTDDSEGLITAVMEYSKHVTCPKCIKI